MAAQHFEEAYGGNAAENYERFFVPAIGAPLAEDLVRDARLGPGDRVLDVACGTGIVARLAWNQVGSDGAVAALDVNPGMLSVARSRVPPGGSIEWYEGSAESMPLPDNTFDVALCQMGLQFMRDKLSALKEMRRVLVNGGRMLLNVPGPAGSLFAIVADALERHISREVAGFVRQVFSLDDASELEQLTSDAGFRDVAARDHEKTLRLPAPEVFLWQYVRSTPLAGIVAQADEGDRAELERDVVQGWQEFVQDGTTTYRQRVIIVSGHR